MEFFTQLFDTSDFPRRWDCGNWSEAHGWLHIVSDLLIFAAYLSIPIAITVFYILKRNDLVFSKILLLFAAFILSCGLTHLVEATLFWHSWYRLSGLLKATTAVMSWVTVIYLLSQIPRALRYAGLAELGRRLEEGTREHQDLLNKSDKNEKQLEALLNSTAEGIYRIDENGECNFANRACVHLLGYDSADELVGKDMHELIHYASEEGAKMNIADCRIFRAAQVGARSHCDDEVFWRKDGSWFPVEYWSYPILEDSGTEGAVVTFFDVTERLKAQGELIESRERAELANRQKTQFLANMSHEIRTPMNAILGFSELMEGVVVSDKAKEYLAIVRASGESLLELINDLLDLSKIEAGRIEIFEESCDFSETISSVVAMMSLTAREKGVSLSFSIDPDVPKFLVFDQLRVRQIVLNLLSNALKFTDQGEVSVTCSISPGEEEDSFTLKLAVSDSGCGIPVNEQRKIFKPFHQVLEDEGAISEGTGLGLSISARLAKLMDGEITVESIVGKGSVFTVTLTDVKSSRIGKQSFEDEYAGVRDLNKIAASKILVVDDNAVNRDFMLELFGNTHHEIFVAENGKEGIELTEKEKPDLVLMDVRMPEIDGRKALGIIKRNTELEKIPIIAVTASSLLNKERKLRKEFDGYLRKPFTKAQIFSAMAAHLDVLDSPESGESINESETDIFEVTIANPKWVDLVTELKEIEATAWPEISKTLAIKAMGEFARNLKRLSSEYECETLMHYSSALNKSAGAFQLSRMESLMGQFPGLVDSIAEAAQLFGNE